MLANLMILQNLQITRVYLTSTNLQATLIDILNYCRNIFYWNFPDYCFSTWVSRNSEVAQKYLLWSEKKILIALERVFEPRQIFIFLLEDLLLEKGWKPLLWNVKTPTHKLLYSKGTHMIATKKSCFLSTSNFGNIFVTDRIAPVVTKVAILD